VHYVNYNISTSARKEAKERWKGELAANEAGQNGPFFPALMWFLRRQRWLILPRHTQPSPDTKLLMEKLRLELPNQPPPRLVAQKESNEIEVQTYR
jgi:hypothetical protein